MVREDVDPIPMVVVVLVVLCLVRGSWRLWTLVGELTDSATEIEDIVD